MRYLKFENIDGAEQRSSELWLQTLGRPKIDEDISTFLYAFEVSESNEGGSYLLIDDNAQILSDTEKASLETEDSYQSWRQQYQPQLVQDELEEAN
tara:strand:+ start:252 stop:539 length:288 start_codon:yes stop_codon:yes gene_type:complete